MTDKPIAGSDGEKHRPVTTLATEQFIVIDNFLPEEKFDALYDYTCDCDYEHINTKGKISRVWRPRDGFPLRGSANLFYFGEGSTEGVSERKKSWIYPTDTGLDRFAEELVPTLPQAEHVIGKAFEDWKKFTVTSWIYPAGTGLSLHEDGANYRGAYVFFLNREWNVHWGGLLMVFPQETSNKVKKYKKRTNAREFVRRKWSNESAENSLLWEPGLAQTILPKRNRIVFISNSALHMVTTVNSSAGDRVRRSLAGFFDNKA